MPEEKGVLLCTIITDDDSNGRSKSRHVVNGGILPMDVEEEQENIENKINEKK